MIRCQGNKVEKYFYFLLVALFTANVFGYIKQIGNDSATDRKIQEDGKESIYRQLYHIGEALCKYVPKEYSYLYNGEGTVCMQTFQMHKKILTGFNDSGSAYPIYANETYAWEYTTNSLKTAVLSAGYDYVTCDASQPVKTDADDKRTVIYQGDGYSNLWIVNEHMYLYRNNSKESKEWELFPLNMQGKDEHTYGDYEVHTIYDRYLVLTDSEETEIHVMDTEAEGIPLLEMDAQHLYTDDDTVHFTECPKNTDEHIVFASVRLDAIECRRLVDVRKEDVSQIIQTSTNLYTSCAQVVKNRVYFSCGTYGGSVSVYQGGVFAKVKRGGSNFKVLGEAPINPTVYETGKIMKYGEISQSFQDDNGSIWIYKDNVREKLIVNGEDYNRCSIVDEYADVRNVDVQKDIVYSSVNYSVPDEPVSIGWRTRYRLQPSVHYRENLKTGISERLHGLQS